MIAVWCETQMNQEARWQIPLSSFQEAVAQRYSRTWKYTLSIQGLSPCPLQLVSRQIDSYRKSY